MKNLIESLSINEKKILPYLEEKNISEICKKSNLDKVSVLRALEYLNNKKIIELETQKKKVIDVGVNGALYKKRGLPERRLLLLLDERRIIPLGDAEKDSGLSPDEFKISLGVLKGKAFIEIKNGKVVLNASKEEISKKSLEELFLESLPIEEDKLAPEQQFSLKSLVKRKEIIEIEERKKFLIKVTPLGKSIMGSKEISKDLIEQITPELLKKEQNWKNKKFRRYDVTSPVPKINGGKRHFVNQAIDYGRKVWIEMGFEEMEGNYIQPSFWVFDSLFTAQDHPVREMQDTFFLGIKGELPDKKIVSTVKLAHEKGVSGSKGWSYNWDEEESKKMVLRTHTTVLSALTLSKLKKEDFPKKYFAIGKCFRNETVDWSHGFEFNQSEGIVVGEGLNFRHLLGYLKQFFNKMGFEKIRFTPAYFPYTEPSVEIHWFHPEKKVWLELGGAGIFRPEVTTTLLGVDVPVLAWGPGFDRILMDYYKIKDLRELYKNDISQLRKMKSWMKV
ncbi:phenylalanine--tRNA ligase subunit alpha [Candidatus Pacearchaeota archaeon CG10_big_fil_rev_8_21_14_0_10_32_42]|nr:MAG: phenylalanine--tRNA ligase subunit alpha [Candidatus Pacearchaeota archaeon CG10_big_fil_rev_8_21_14_0_10_32_42]